MKPRQRRCAARPSRAGPEIYVKPLKQVLADGERRRALREVARFRVARLIKSLRSRPEDDDVIAEVLEGARAELRRKKPTP